MELFINGAGIISPQPYSDADVSDVEKLIPYDHSTLKCSEPDYKNYINPTQLRRMSRMIKMGIAAAKICLKNAEVEMPDAIITGTGLGCLEDTEKFIHSIIENNEQHLSPTPFIQSTHNTVGGQIALLLGCHEYNSTYVHRGLSFESALIDASMLLEEGTAENVLVGGLDELTDNSNKLLSELGIYAKKDTQGLALNKGASGGEGAAFFLLSKEQNEKTIAKITALKCYSGQTDLAILTSKINECFVEAGKNIDEINYFLTGKTGNIKTDKIYQSLGEGPMKNSTKLSFKQYCGEYHTASAFGLWLAAGLVKKASSPTSVLIYNHFGGTEHSLMIVEKC